jgi:hypothetical protein
LSAPNFWPEIVASVVKANASNVNVTATARTALERANF